MSKERSKSNTKSLSDAEIISKPRRSSDPVQQKSKDMPIKLEKPIKARGVCTISESTSHTKFYRKPRHEDDFKVITRNEYCNISESISSSDTFRCVHGPDGKVYTQKGLLKRNFLKNLDPVPPVQKWIDECPPSYGWCLPEKIQFLIENGLPLQQLDRLQAHLRDLVTISNNGFRVDILKNLMVIFDYLLDTMPKVSVLEDNLKSLLGNLKKPIILSTASDVVKYFDEVRSFIGFLGYLLMRIEQCEFFDMVAEAVIWHLSAPDSVRSQTMPVLSRQNTLAAASILTEPSVKMIAMATSYRFPAFLKVALLLACHTEDNCIEMMKENAVENIFYRFNPYFPQRPLPVYDINPADCQDPNVVLGDSSVHMSTTMSLLLVLLNTTRCWLLKDPQQGAVLPHPNDYSQRCFIWAYRYECRAREHGHNRNTLTIIATALLKCFGARLRTFSSWLMPDIMSLSVLTEVPLRDDWTRTVNINTMQQDVVFKKVLIYFVVDALKVFPYNTFLVTSRHWLLGLTYLIDPGLSSLRAHWSPALFAEIRKIALQALVCCLPLCDPNLVMEYSLIRRLLWYVEWYSENPYEISTLYWCLRVLQVSVYERQTVARENSIRNLLNTHGIIIIINTCYTLLNQREPPVEKSQAVIALCLRLLTNAVHADTQQYVTCCVYPNIKWPMSVITLTTKMLNMVLCSLEKHAIISDRWLVSLLNLIWEGVIWKKEYREKFVKSDGIYKLLDLITLTRPMVQCIACALICDVAISGLAVGHLVSWRAPPAASYANPVLVKRGSTIATLLAAIFRDGCRRSEICLNENGIWENDEFPVMKSSVVKALNNSSLCYMKSPSSPLCHIASDLAGSRMSKAFALLHMLSKDLEDKVAIADDAYKLYKDINLRVEDETILILCSHYLTLKLVEVWWDIKLKNSGIIYPDNVTLEEFEQIGLGWLKELKRQQEDAVRRAEKKELVEESSLYAFLGRIRLNIALDALKEVRCIARSSGNNCITNSLIQDAVFAHHRLSVFAKKLETPILKTYVPNLDDTNITGQNVKVYSIKQQPQNFSSSCSSK